MTRCEEFYEKVVRDGNFCGMRKDHYEDLIAYIELVREYPPLGEIKERELRPLFNEKDSEVKRKAIKTLGKQIEHGNVATAKQVSTILENIRGRIPTKGGDHLGAVKPKGKVLPDLSGVYKPPTLPAVSEDIQDKDEYQNDIDEETEYTDVEEEEDTVLRDALTIHDIEGDTVEGIPETPEEDITEEVLVAPEDETVDIETKENEKPNEEDVKTNDNRIKMLNRAEERRADAVAEEEVVKCLNSILRRGYPRQKLSWLMENALREVLIPDGGCPMPNSSVTKGGAITTNLGGR